MEVAVLPKERVELKRRFTDSPQAYAAYLRSRSLVDESYRRGENTDGEVNEKIALELESAIALDSNFSAAWGRLAQIRSVQAGRSPDDSALARRARDISRRALSRAPSEPFAQLAAAGVALYLDKNESRARPLVKHAIRLAPNDAAVLEWASGFYRGSFGSKVRDQDSDSAQILSARAATLDPRSAQFLFLAARDLVDRSRFLDARRAANAILAMDSADARGWMMHNHISIYTGDSLAMQRDFCPLVSKVRITNVFIAAGLVSSGRDASRWFLSRGLSQYRISDWTDSLWYYDGKSVASLSLGDEARSRVYSDSVIRLTSRHRLSGFKSIEDRIGVAFAHANLDDTTSARRALASIIADARSQEATEFPVGSMDVFELAASYARIGDLRDALSWMQATVEGRRGTAQFYLVDPRFRALSRTPELQKFLREHPVQAR